MYLTRECDTGCHLFNKHYVCFVPATVLSALKILNPNNANEREILLLSSLYRGSHWGKEWVSCPRSQYQFVFSQEEKSHFGHFRRDVTPFVLRESWQKDWRTKRERVIYSSPEGAARTPSIPALEKQKRKLCYPKPTNVCSWDFWKWTVGLLGWCLLAALQEASSLPGPLFLEPAQRSTALLRLLEPQERKSAFYPPPDYWAPVSRTQLETSWHVSLGHVQGSRTLAIQRRG